MNKETREEMVYWRLRFVDFPIRKKLNGCGNHRRETRLTFYLPILNPFVLSWKKFMFKVGSYSKLPNNSLFIGFDGDYILDGHYELKAGPTEVAIGDFPDEIVNGVRKITEEEIMKSFRYLTFYGIHPFVDGGVFSELEDFPELACKYSTRLTTITKSSIDYALNSNDPEIAKDRIDCGKFSIDMEHLERYRKKITQICCSGLYFDFLINIDKE